MQRQSVSIYCYLLFTANITTQIPSQGHAYRGQVTLVPPTSAPANASHSYGAVIIKKEETDDAQWRFVNQGPQIVDKETADTMCRQMGYTDAVPNSVMNLSRAEMHGDEYDLNSM